MAKRLIVDLDGTLTVPSDNNYENAVPNAVLVNKLRDYKANGYEIVIFSARNMRTFERNVGKINIYTLPLIIEWLNRHEVPYDEVLIGKPWCGYEGFYIDDRAVRPNEFVSMSSEEILQLFKEDLV